MARQLAKPVEAIRLAAALSAETHGPADTLITGVASLDSAAQGDLCFFSDSKFLERARSTAAAAVICRPEDVAALPAGLSKIVHKSPHLAFAQALDFLFPVAAAQAGISPHAVIGADTQLNGVQVEAFSQIGARTRIGASSIIHGHVNIGADVRIGQGCVIYPHVTLYPGTVLGDRCIVHAGTVLGADGFGFQPTARGWLKVQQVGSVVVGNDVEIGANTAIDCGAIDDTIIADGVKIDNLVQIAHNCQIGAHTAIAACVGIAGSTRIGSRCMIGGAAMIVGHIDICDDVIVSGGTVIAASIETPGRYTGIFPSTDHRSWAKVAAQLRRSVNANRRAKAADGA